MKVLIVKDKKNSFDYTKNLYLFLKCMGYKILDYKNKLSLRIQDANKKIINISLAEEDSAELSSDIILFAPDTLEKREYQINCHKLLTYSDNSVKININPDNLVTYGLCNNNTITTSSIDSNKTSVSIQNEFKNLNNTLIIQQEIIMHHQKIDIMHLLSMIGIYLLII